MRPGLRRLPPHATAARGRCPAAPPVWHRPRVWRLRSAQRPPHRRAWRAPSRPASPARRARGAAGPARRARGARDARASGRGRTGRARRSRRWSDCQVPSTGPRCRRAGSRPSAARHAWRRAREPAPRATPRAAGHRHRTASSRACPLPNHRAPWPAPDPRSTRRPCLRRLRRPASRPPAAARARRRSPSCFPEATARSSGGTAAPTRPHDPAPPQTRGAGPRPTASSARARRPQVRPPPEHPRG